MEVCRKLVSPKVAEIFATMEYGPAPESDKIAQQWLDDHNRSFGHFINNAWVKPENRKTYETVSPSDGKFLSSTLQGTSDDVNVAVSAAKSAQEKWSKLSCHERARHLYNVERHVQKHSRLIAVIESLDNGKSIRETRDADVPVLIRHLDHYAGWAELMDEECKGMAPLGVVGAIVPWNFPLMLLVWKVAPALAMGNTVVLKPATVTRLSALLFAEICAEAGLPPGVFNVVTGGGAMGQTLATHPDVDKVAFTGSTEVGKILKKAIAGSGRKISLELGGKSPVVIYENADLDSTVENVVDAIWFNQGQVCSAGSKLLIQESIFDDFCNKIKTRLGHYRIGHSLDKTIDMGAIVSKDQLESISKYVDEAKEEGAEVFQIDIPENVNKAGLWYPPTLITHVSTASKVTMEEIFGPVVVALPFRTSKEAINLANNTLYGLAASVHSEQLTLALETAKNIKAGTVWINCHNMFDAAAGFGGYKQSGYGRDGGQEGLWEYMKPSFYPKIKNPSDEYDISKFGAVYNAGKPAVNGFQDANDTPQVDHTYKLYYGGSQKRPDGNYVQIIRNIEGHPVAEVGQSNRKDVRNAVEAAIKAQPGWEKRSGFNRAQILRYIAENLSLRKSEFSLRLANITGSTNENANSEVEKSIRRLFYWAAYADKYGGTVQETQVYGTVIKIHEPVGVIGIACPDENPFLNFVSLLGPAIARSNAVVIAPSQKYPTLALDMYQVFETSDLPGGVVNILTGDRDHITKYLTEHQNVDAMWYFGSPEGSKFVEHASTVNVKRTWVNHGMSRDWTLDEQGQGAEFLYHSVQPKNVWLTMGDIFAN